MREFISAAAPWLVIGAAIAFILAFTVQRKSRAAGQTRQNVPEQQRPDRQEEQDAGNYLAEGMCLGMCLGVVLGMTVLDNLAAGLSIGMCLGLAIGCNIKRRPGA